MESSRTEPAPVEPEEIRYRRMIAEDVDAVAAIENEAFAKPWHQDTFRSLVRRGDAELWVGITPEDEIVTYSVLWCADDQGELANIAVSLPHQGRGLGAAHLEKVLEVARDRGVKNLFLEVRMSNERAHGMYIRRGFEQVGIRRGYYQEPKEDARVLVKRL